MSDQLGIRRLLACGSSIPRPLSHQSEAVDGRLVGEKDSVVRAPAWTASELCDGGKQTELGASCHGRWILSVSWIVPRHLPAPWRICFGSLRSPAYKGLRGRGLARRSGSPRPGPKTVGPKTVGLKTRTLKAARIEGRFEPRCLGQRSGTEER
jgi:hypothetical protein